MSPQPSIPHVDVVIIGGGFAGVATAYFLTRQGIHDIIVLERESTCGMHASGRNAALGRQLTEHDAFSALAIRGASFLRTPPVEVCSRPLLFPTGSLLLASSEASLARLSAAATRHLLPQTLSMQQP